MLLDLEPVIADNWDALPDPVAPAVTQVWLEHRPPFDAASTPLANEFARRIVHDAASSIRSDAERCRPGPHRHRSSPSAECRGELGGPERPESLAGGGGGPRSPLVRGVAAYALVHAGSASPDDAATAPARPLLLQPSERNHRRSGRGTIRIGPLQPLVVPLRRRIRCAWSSSTWMSTC